MFRTADASVSARACKAPARKKGAIGLLVTLVVSTLLVIVPASPAGAIQTIAWTTQPPATSTVGNQISFAWSGTANTFLGARITGCFANFPEGNNYTRSFGGNFTTGNCNIVNRVIPLAGTYQIVAGFNLSTGGSMTMTWNISVAAPTPTVYTSGNVTATAQSVNGAPAFYSAYGSDAVYGTYSASCVPASGSTFPVGVSTVQCSATNGGGKTGTSSLTVTVQKYTPVVTWNPPSTINHGTPLGSLMNATVDRADAGSNVAYYDAHGNQLTSSSVLPAGSNQVIRAVYIPTTTAQVNAYNSADVTKTINVLQIPQTAQFISAPATKTYGDAPFVVQTQGTPGGGAVLINRTPWSTCTVDQLSYSTSSQAMVTITGVGPCVLTAFQIQEGPYSVSPTVQHSVTVAKATPIVTLTVASGESYGPTLEQLVAASPNVPGTFSYLLNGEPVVPGDAVLPGSWLVTAVFTPTDTGSYTQASASETLVVIPAPQTIAVAPLPSALAYGDVSSFEVDATSSAGGAVQVTVTGPCSVLGSTVTITGVGDCAVSTSVLATATHAASAANEQLVVIEKGTPNLAWADPASIGYGTPLGASQLNATVLASPTGLTPFGELVYSPAEGEVLDAGTHALHVSFLPFSTESELWNATSAIVELAVAPAMPDITWDAPSTITYGTPIGASQLQASSVSAGTLAYSPAAGTVLDAGDHFLIVEFTSTDPNYLSGVTGVPITVAKAAQHISFEIPGNHTYGDAPFTVSATGGGSGNPVWFSALPGSICSVGGMTVTITGAGPCVIAATQEGGPNHLPAPTVVRSAAVDPAVPTIEWDAPAGITYGTALGATQLDASITESDATGEITYFLADGVTPADGVLLHAGDDQVLTAVFAPDAEGSANYVPTAATVTIDVAQATQAITFDPLDDVTYGDDSFELVATGGGSGLPVTFTATGAGCSVNGTTVTIVAAGQCTIAAAQAGTGDFLSAPLVEQTLIVDKATQTLAIGAIAGHTFGDAPFAVDVTPGASGVPVLLSAEGECSVSGVEVAILHAGSCTITGQQGSGDNHLAADPASVTFAIAKAGQAITFAPLTTNGAATYLDPALEATVSGGTSGEPVVVTATGGACDVVGTTVTITHAGTCTVTASQAGTGDFLAADDVSQTLAVARFQASVSWTPQGLTYGDPVGAGQLNATSSPEVTGSITYSVEPGTVLGAGTHELTATFTPDLGDDVAGVEATAMVTVDRARQTITFDPIQSRTFGDAPFAVTATGGASGNPVTFTSGTDDCTATPDGTVAVVATGDCAISADQAGNGDFDAAATVTQFFGVGKAAPVVSFPAPAAITYGTPLAVAATVDGVDGTFTYTPALGTVLHASTTPQTLTVQFDPTDTDSYVSVAQTTTIVVNPAAQVIDMPAVADRTFGDAPFGVTAIGGGSSQPVVLSATGDCSVADTTVTITGAGSCSLEANQAGDADHLAATPVTRSFGIAKAAGSVALASIGGRTFGDAPLDLVVTPGALGGAVTLSATGGCAVTPTGQLAISAAGPCSVTATQAEGRNVLVATATQSFTVAQAAQTLAFGTLADRTYGDPTFQLSATPGASGQPVTYSASGAACAVTGTTVTVLAAGTCTITANQAGGTNHLAATPVVRTLLVRAGNLTVTPAAAARSYGQSDPTFTYTLTGFAGGDTASVVTTSPVCTTTATVASPVGRYPITCAGGVSAKYGFTYETADLTVGRMPTRLAITNPSTAVAGSTTISATLTDALSGAPVMGEPVLLSADLTIRTATSSPATTTLNLSSGVHVIGALYLGDANHLPSIDGQLLVSYTPTKFVIWGGNTDGVQVGRDYTFHGSQWSKQVKQGTYGAGSSFKGFATNLNAAGTSWTTTTGSSTGLPAEIGDVISVLVSTSITKSGSNITGNATKQVLLVVDDPSDYRPNGNGTYEGTLLTSL